MDIVTRFINYVKDTRQELRHVSWPTRNQAIAYTVIVVIVSLIIAAFLGALDFIFTSILDRFVI
jgi:preprotein translocase subunit SecE